ncbi:hypothetical protein EDC01DRAFT_784168 [Geopyxis carbonaria]|nr:hypothetical protein EDC01DRAFT_784168 [Geopyxis carbonaria]
MPTEHGWSLGGGAAAGGIDKPCCAAPDADTTRVAPKSEAADQPYETQTTSPGTWTGPGRFEFARFYAIVDMWAAQAGYLYLKAGVDVQAILWSLIALGMEIYRLRMYIERRCISPQHMSNAMWLRGAVHAIASSISVARLQATVTFAYTQARKQETKTELCGLVQPGAKQECLLLRRRHEDPMRFDANCDTGHHDTAARHDATDRHEYLPTACLAACLRAYVPWSGRPARPSCSVVVLQGKPWRNTCINVRAHAQRQRASATGSNVLYALYQASTSILGGGVVPDGGREVQWTLHGARYPAITPLAPRRAISTRTSYSPHRPLWTHIAGQHQSPASSHVEGIATTQRESAEGARGAGP